MRKWNGAVKWSIEEICRMSLKFMVVVGSEIKKYSSFSSVSFTVAISRAARIA